MVSIIAFLILHSGGGSIMDEKKRVISLIFIMAASVLIVAGVAITTLYRTAIKEEQARLVETAQSQARLIEAVARFDQKYSKDYPRGWEAATLSQIIDAHEHYAGFGKTGEFTLSKKEKENIVFLLSHRHFDLDRPRPVPFDSELAEPMRMALLGRSGTVVGLDYRGEVVVAAHEPVAELGLGIVAKIDLSEIRTPFLRAGAIAGIFTVLVVLAGASLFIKITNPMIRQLQTRTVELETMTDEMSREIEERKLAEAALSKSEEKYRNLFEHANDSIFIIDPSSRQLLDVNENAAKRLGYTRDELLQLTIDDITTPMGAKHSHDIIRELLNAGNVTFEHTHLGKDKTEIQVEISSRVIEYGDRQVFQSIVRDITERKRIEEALSWEADVNNTLSELSRTLISPSSIEDISSQVLEASKKLTASALGYAGYIDPETGYLICPTMTRDIWESCQVKEKNIIFKTFHGLWGWVLDNRKPILTNSPSKDSRSAGIPEGHMPIRRFLSSPATYGNDVVGQISLANPIRGIANIYAMVIHRKRAEDDLQRAHDNLEKRVEERTSDLKKSNVHLKQEIAERKRMEKALRKSEKQLRALAARIQEVQETERKHLAQELHDRVGQSLSALNLNLNIITSQLSNESNTKIGGRIQDSMSLVEETTVHIRDVMAELHPQVLDDYGLLAALRWYCERFSDRAEIDVEVRGEEPSPRLPLIIESIFFRIAQEALTNVSKHAEASLASVTLEDGEEHLRMTVEDNGRGINLTALNRSKELPGWGLTTMKERAATLGGRLSIESEPDKGTRIITEFRR
jgi:PAS domain S-box-containing protein